VNAGKEAGLTGSEGEESGSRTLRIAAVGDFHCGGHDHGADLTGVFANVASDADILLLMGDMTTHGEPDQVEEFLGYVAGVDIPMLSVLGNHDHETDQADVVTRMLEDAGGSRSA
jgi:predicted MPP superfamily phosphohydrolase